MDIMLTGEDQSQADQPNGLAEACVEAHTSASSLAAAVAAVAPVSGGEKSLDCRSSFTELKIMDVAFACREWMWTDVRHRKYKRQDQSGAEDNILSEEVTREVLV
eukprot:703535-Pelagomonas_calceolata.AAC.5